MTPFDAIQPPAAAATTPDLFEPAAFLRRLEGFLLGQHGLGAVLGWTNDQLDTVQELGDQLLAAGRSEDARTLYEGILALDPARGPAYCRLAICHHQEGNRAHAALCVSAARQLLGDAPGLADLARELGHPA